VGERSSVLAMTLDFLRAKRGQVSSSFTFLAIGMHVALVALLVFVVQVILLFSRVVEGVYTEAVAEAQTMAVEVFSFSFDSVRLLEILILPCILVMSVTNAFAIKTADGGSRYKIFVYLGVTLSLSGAGLVIVPMLASRIFSTIPSM